MPVPADPSVPDAPDAARLGTLARNLLRATTVPLPDPPLLVALAWDAVADHYAGGADVQVLPLAGTGDPVRLLCHQRAHPSWAVIGVFVDGWTLPPAPDVGVDWRTMTLTSRISEHPQRVPIHTLHLVSRGGAVALGLHGPMHPEPEVHATDHGADPGGPCGPLPDSLRRVFGLPTPPSDISACELWASVWLELVLAAKPGRKTTWGDVANEHPGAEIMALAGERATPQAVTAMGRVLGRAKGWDELQLAALTGGDSWWFLPPADIAAWADTGMFARLVMRKVLPLWATRQRLAKRLSPAVLRMIDDVLDSWDLDATPPATPLEAAS